MRNLGLFILAAAALAACDPNNDSESGPSGITTCGAFSACGGDVVGTWRLQSFCTDDFEAALGMAIDHSECADAFVDVDVMTTGTYTYEASESRTAMISGTIEMHYLYSAACLSALNDGAQVDVAQACGTIDARLMANPNVTDSSCLFDGTFCDCQIAMATNSTHTETYRASNNQLLSPDDAPSDYCVTRDTLQIVEHEDEADILLTFTREP